VFLRVYRCACCESIDITTIQVLLLLLFVRGVVSTTRTTRFWPPIDPHGFAVVVVLTDVRVPIAAVSVVGVFPTFDDGVGGVVVVVGIPIGVVGGVAVVALTLTGHLSDRWACFGNLEMRSRARFFFMRVCVSLLFVRRARVVWSF
jgi:hypothetical protein